MAEILDVLRTEQKYQLNNVEMYSLMSRLAAVLKSDSHNDNGGYMVRSLYFDTPNDSDYYDKLDGLELRRKIRLRVYSPHADTAKLELKEKTGNAQRKRSLSLNRDQASQVINGRYEVLLDLKDEFATELYGRMNQYVYRPKCMVQYLRTAFAEDVNETRVTFDRDLRASVADFNIFSDEIELYPVGLITDCTMEVKFNNFLLSYVKDAVSLSDKLLSSASKYGMSRNYLLREEP